MKTTTKALVAIVVLTAGVAAAAGTSTYAWFQVSRAIDMNFTDFSLSQPRSSISGELISLAEGETISEDKRSISTASVQKGYDVSSKDGLNFYAPKWAKKAGNDAQLSGIKDVTSESGIAYAQVGMRLATKVGEGTAKISVDLCLTSDTAIQASTVNVEDEGEKAIQTHKNESAAQWTRVAIVEWNDVNNDDHLDEGELGDWKVTFENKATAQGNAEDKYMTGSVTADRKMELATYAESEPHDYLSYANPETETDPTHPTPSRVIGTLSTENPEAKFVARVWLEGTECDDQSSAKGGNINVVLGITAMDRADS